MGTGVCAGDVELENVLLVLSSAWRVFGPWDQARVNLSVNVQNSYGLDIGSSVPAPSLDNVLLLVQHDNVALNTHTCHCNSEIP